MQLTFGSLLARRYRLVNRIGAGRLGELWRGADLVPTRQVAIRVVQPDVPVSEEALHAFSDDARLLRALSHPSLARVLDVGETEDGARFVVTEVLHGETLEDLLDRRGTLSPGGALQLVASIAQALAETHRLGVVHLGVEPRSIFLHRTPDGRITPKLLDFGRARLLARRRGHRGGEAGEETIDPALAYRSPEQIADDPRTGPTADVWALGVLLFRCVTGRLPFEGKTVMAHHTLALSAQSLVKSVRTLDAGVRELILECLKYTRGERISALVLADRARLVAWSTVGGWNDVEQMVRVPGDVSDPALFGAIDHVETIPGPAPSMASLRVAPKQVVPPPIPKASPVDRSESGPIAPPMPVSLPMVPARDTPRAADTLRPVSADVAALRAPEPPQHSPSIGGDVRALRPKVSQVWVGGVGSVVAFCIGAIVATTQPAPRAPRQRGHAPAAAAIAAVADEAPKPRVKPAAVPHVGVVNAIATVAAKPALLPASEVAKPKLHPTPKVGTSAPSKSHESVEAAPSIPNLQGVPLWDGPVAKPKPAPKPADDNPYE